ncbi:hypothetical protein ES703_00522 [subsurface metagenome]
MKWELRVKVRRRDKSHIFFTLGPNLLLFNVFPHLPLPQHVPAEHRLSLAQHPESATRSPYREHANSEFNYHFISPFRTLSSTILTSSIAPHVS